MIFSWISSLKSGGGGSSVVRKRKGDSSTLHSYSPLRSASSLLNPSMSVGMIFLVWILMLPRKFL